MDAYAAEPRNQNHPENETDWSGLFSAVADQVGGLIVIAVAVMLAMVGGTLLIYAVARQRRMGRSE